MEIVEQDGLVVALVDQQEAASRTWTTCDRPVDIARLTGSEGLDGAALAELGFTARPRWVNWCAQVRDSEEEFESGLSRTERRNGRLARRFVQEQQLRAEVRQGLAEDVLDAFLDVYDEQIAGMPRGKNFARRERERLLAAAPDHVSVCVYAGEAMVAGSLWRVRRGESVLQMRFSAASADARSGRVMRAAYGEAFRFARDHGLEFASLGNDPSLFGHVVQPGLFNFKSRLGFGVVPSQVLDPNLAGEFADRFLSLRSLSDPSLVVTWGGRRGEPLSWPAAASSPGHDLLLLSGKPEPGLLDAFNGDGFRERRLLVVSS
ncbi:hypothetical protein [Streptomyces sp. CB01881]|uniref:hypothetical protein n=1 Tax=Streptomyces sp. CB01881 TaxID=2078691 RepID=UPI000CDBC399|nr:hypothetical protein [Streptomyces sp. CB01881]AUY53126.1 hypothetical protein C2142_34140 [Streptomyces sp. CB01881]TYC69278.1 hypothetical protein EH183_34205 [Streptomyces sp. CB01881]